jgi:hypothetical protein
MRICFIVYCLIVDCNRTIKELLKGFVTPPTALRLNDFRLASLHLLLFGPCAMCLGFPTVINTLATRLVQSREPHFALETSVGASSSLLDLPCVHVRTVGY